jgi:hypothetical protein
MKIKKGFRLRTVCGENIIVADGIENIDFSKIISMNESAAYLWQKVEGKDFSADDLASLLFEEYEVDEATALADARTVAQQWIDAGIVN